VGKERIEIVMGTRYVNGKFYPLWEQFVEQSSEWEGGILTDYLDNFEKRLGLECLQTTIKRIELVPNGESSAMFNVVGEDFTCGFDVRYGGLSPYGVGMGITFEGYGSHEFHIQKKEKVGE